MLSVVSLALALVGGYITGRFQSNKETLLLDSGGLMLQRCPRIVTHFEGY